MIIKNKETLRLAQQLAQLAAESMPDAVTTALRERLDRVLASQGTAPLSERLLAIGKVCASRFKKPFRTIDRGDFLYDEHGLPK